MLKNKHEILYGKHHYYDEELQVYNLASDVKYNFTIKVQTEAL
jgi:hypothetical protein